MPYTRVVKVFVAVYLLAGIIVTGTAAGKTASEGNQPTGAAAAETRVCPACNAKVPTTATFCPNCHHYFSDAKVETKVCPLCGKNVAAVLKNCPSCNYRFPVSKPPSETAAEENPVPGSLTPQTKPPGPEVHGILHGGVAKGSGMTNGGGGVALGVRTEDNTFFGAGIGYESYPNASAVLLSGTMRADFLKYWVSPALTIEGGYAIRKFKSAPGAARDASGFLFGAGAAVDVFAKGSAGVTFEAGGRYEMSKKVIYYMDQNGNIIDVDSSPDSYLFFTTGAGVLF